MSVATLSIQPKEQVIAHAGDTLIMNCMLTGLQQADQGWHVPWDLKYKADPAQKQRFTTQWTAQGILQLIISPITYQDAGSYQCKSETAGLEKTVHVWIPGPDPITGTCFLMVYSHQEKANAFFFRSDGYITQLKSDVARHSFRLVWQIN